MAKVALEALAMRLCEHPGGLEYLCDEAQLDPVRDHARRGKTPVWPVSSRRIYEADSEAIGEDGVMGQVVHEFDFLITSTQEYYFVLVIFGQELTINIGGPDIKGYLQWLNKNGERSPLYTGGNQSSYPRPID
jgi:hypothetical protein